jgi:4-carboxymuconolactone decarboxylase
VDQYTYAKGRAIRSAVLGEDHVTDALSSADEFSRPLQDLVTEYCWGAVWGRDGLPLATRSLLNVAMLSALNRPQQLRIHLLGALKNGVTRHEIREVLLQVAIYAGVPAAVDGLRIASDTFAELDADE